MASIISRIEMLLATNPTFAIFTDEMASESPVTR
jgi:hypothetical protein